MTVFFTVLILLSVTLVAIVLTMGLYSLARGGDFSKRHSNRLMRWRITLQVVALAIIAFSVYIKKSHMG